MTVFPDSTLYIISGCPCDPDYEHTLYWANKEGQHAYFMTKAKYIIHDMSYQRAKRGRIRVQYKVEDLYDCNYIAFKNTSFGDKWFYAFIDDVTYVNNITSEISYTIDVIQTWITDMDLQQSFVVREHSVTDNVGDNLIPEDVETGEMVYVDYPHKLIPDASSTQAGNLGIGVCQASGASGNLVDGGFYGNTFEQININTNYSADATSAGAVRDMLMELGVFDNQQAVTSIFMYPKALKQFVTKNSDAGGGGLIFTANERTGLKRSDGTNVKNNKLNTYPYTYLELSNLSTATKKFAYEYFLSDTPYFMVYGSISNTLTITAVATGYKTVGALANDFNSCLSYSFPECAWSTTDFANRGVTCLLSGAVGALSGALTGGVGGAIIGGAIGALQGQMSGAIGNTSGLNYADLPFPNLGAREDLGGSRLDRSSEIASRGATAQIQAAIALASTPIRPLSSNPSTANSNDLFNAGWYGFSYAQMKPHPQFIDRIDDYFSRYGYKTNSIKVPNISSRPQWNYVQTIGCKIGGSIPCQDEKLICSIFDKGVTFWKHPENVGDFSLDNSPS